VAATDDYNAIGDYLDNHRVTMALVIPPKFADHILKKEPAKIQVLVDGSEGNTTAISMGYVNQIVLKYSTQILTEMIATRGTIGGVNAEVRSWFNPSLRSRNSMVPGILVLILLITTTNLTAMAIVREKEIGTLEQIMVTPITPSELILGKLIPYTLFGLIDVCVVLIVMVFFFDIPVKGSVPLLFGLTGFPLHVARVRTLRLDDIPYPTAGDDDRDFYHPDADDVPVGFCIPRFEYAGCPPGCLLLYSDELLPDDRPLNYHERGRIHESLDPVRYASRHGNVDSLCQHIEI
jgi:hypothetical protein